MPKSKTFYKIISVVIAILLWAYVIEVTDPVKNQTISDLPVQLLNAESLADRGLALSGDAEYMVDVLIQGKRADLSRITEGDILAEADLFGYSIGKNSIPVMVTAPRGVSIAEVKPLKINVVIEERVEVAKPIRVAFLGQFEEGVEAGQITTKPEVIQVSGAKSEVGAVSHIKAEVPVSRLTAESSTIQTRAVAVNDEGDVVQNVRLSSSYIDVTARLNAVKEVPLKVEITGELAPIYELIELNIPESIKIKGDKAALEKIGGLTGAAIDISAISSTSDIPVVIPLPEGIEFAAGYENLTVTISIKPVATKTFTYTSEEIRLEGIEGIQNITITTPYITVTASGSEIIISGLKKEDLKPYLELDAESLISATAKVQVHYDKQLGHIETDPEEVHITLDQTD
ncbi:MAG: CdaR family protein [Eubacteriales bacterium]|nr:CdaR family protein [Eubacteriales bacterium]